MKQRIDMHCHTNFSFDSEQTLDQLCQAMIAQGVENIAITDHIEPLHPDFDYDITVDWPAWQKAVTEAQEKYPELTILRGCEIGDHPQARERIMNDLTPLHLDYHLLSMHLIDGKWDPYNTAYYEGRNRAEAYRLYVESKLEGALNFPDYDALSHIGYVGRYGPYPVDELELKYEDAPELFDQLFRHLIQNGKALEVNTSGIKQLRTFMPSTSLLKRYKELGGELFVFGSDCHDPQRAYDRIEEAKELVRSLGGGYQCRFVQRKMEAFRI